VRWYGTRAGCLLHSRRHAARAARAARAACLACRRIAGGPPDLLCHRDL